MPAMYAALLQQGKVEHEARSQARRVVQSLKCFRTFAQWRASVREIVCALPAEGTVVTHRWQPAGHGGEERALEAAAGGGNRCRVRAAYGR